MKIISCTRLFDGINFSVHWNWPYDEKWSTVYFLNGAIVFNFSHIRIMFSCVFFRFCFSSYGNELKFGSKNQHQCSNNYTDQMNIEHALAPNESIINLFGMQTIRCCHQTNQSRLSPAHISLSLFWLSLWSAIGLIYSFNTICVWVCVCLCAFQINATRFMFKLYFFAFISLLLLFSYSHSCFYIQSISFLIVRTPSTLNLLLFFQRSILFTVDEICVIRDNIA